MKVRRLPGQATPFFLETVTVRRVGSLGGAITDCVELSCSACATPLRLMMQILEPPVQGRLADSKLFCCGDLISTCLYCSKNEQPFHLPERAVQPFNVASNDCLRFYARRVSVNFRDIKFRVKSECPQDAILQLSHVSRPTVVH